MARGPMRPCTYPNCPNLVEAGRCPRHKYVEQREIDARRGTAASRGYTHTWHKARDQYLERNPWCSTCLGRGVRTEAEVVDHIKPHKGDMKLFWDKLNWQPLCRRCHNRKTAIQDGRWN